MQDIRYQSFVIYPINTEILKDLKKNIPSPESKPFDSISESSPAVKTHPANSCRGVGMMNGVEGGVEGGSTMAAASHAYQLSKMRVSQKPTGTTPTTPTQSNTNMLPTPTTPAFHMFYGNTEECHLEDLQLAAELGKTLLERNRELESNIKHHQAVIDDQAQEIEYLSKQTAALREVNDSRLRIYEQLEISIQELEKNNQRLTAENSADKRKIKGFCQQLESLEAKNDDLNKQLEEARNGANQRGRNKSRRSIIMDEHNRIRSHSCENTIQNSEERAAEEMEYRTHVDELQERLRDAHSGRLSSERLKEELEIQLSCLTQENNVMAEQLSVLKEKEFNLRSFDDELASLDDNSSDRLCRKCLGHVDETASNSMIDLHDSIEDTDISIDSVHGECALVKLKNGGYAWGSQESLASIGQVINRNGSGGTSPGTDTSDAPHNSLLSELDTSYRILIEKYEALLESREIQQHHAQEKMMIDTSCNHEGLINSGYDEYSGPMSLVMTGSQMQHNVANKCNHCNTCSCDLKGSRPKSSLEEYSEVETNSSGFSDGESRLSNKETQTEDITMKETLEDITPTPVKCLDLSSPINPCDKRFQAAPEYKKLFAEIFTVLKQTVETDTTATNGKCDQAQQYCDRSDTKTPSSTVTETLESEADSSNIIENEDLKTPVVEQKNTPSLIENEKDEDTKEKASISRVLVNASQKEKASASVVTTDSDSTAVPSECSEGIDTDTASVDQKVEDGVRVYHKPPRPDSLDLLSGSDSRPSSRQKRRHRRRSRQRVEHQQVPYSGPNQYSHGNNSYANQQQQQQQQQYYGGNPGRQHRRDYYNYYNFNQRQNNQQNVHQSRQGEDYPSLGRDEAGKSTSGRVYYNSDQGRCDHHSSKRHRERSSHQKQHRNAENIENNEQQTQSQHNQTPRNYQDNKNKISYPSVEVAKLRKLEMSYAEVLKVTMGRSNYNRRY